jgi:hypothetical protein
MAAVLAASLVARAAGADVLCSGHKGRVFVRPSCKKREMPLELPKGATGATGAAAPAPVRVVDGAGHQVGLYAQPASEDSDLAVLFEVGSRLVWYYVMPQGFMTFFEFYHLVPHCADPPLMVGAPGALVRHGLVRGTTAYYPEDPIELQHPVSREKPPGGPSCGADETLPDGNCCEALASSTATVGPVTKAFDLPSLGLTPPLHLEP